MSGSSEVQAVWLDMGFQRIKGPRKMNDNLISKPARRSVAAIFAVSLMVVSGCASTYGSGTVNSSAVGTVATVRQGTVVAVRQVTIRQENSRIGIATGAILGGLAGSELGGGDKAQTAGGVAGAVLGGIAGNEAGKALGTKPGLAITVDFGKDEIREIIQPADIAVQIGQMVNVSFRADGVFITPAY